MNLSANSIAERLINTVARAFYVDSVVVVLDALIREKYIREEEIGPRLKLSNKDTKKILTQLDAEMLVKYEDLTMEDQKTSRCWYIDYHTFVDVVRYRVHILQQSLLQQEQVEMNRIFFQCPKCLQNYSELQAQRLLSKDFKFICSNCSPNDDLRATMSEPYFTLIEQDNKSKLHDVLNLDRKMKEQFHESLNDSATTGIPRCNHLGIFELLSLLKDKTLIRNKPSENIKRGLFTSRITDSATLLEIEENSKVMRGRALKESSQRADGKDKDGSLIVELVSDLDERSPTVKDAVHDKGGGGDRGGGGESSLPTFLRGSRIAGARNEDVVESNVLIASEKKRTFSELGASALSTASKVESEFFSAFGNSGNVSNGSTVMSMPVPARTSSEVIRELNDENIEWENED